MTNQKRQISRAYKDYLAYSNGTATPKKARKFKKPSSPSMKSTLVTMEAGEHKPSNIVVSPKNPLRKQSTAELLEEAQLKKALKRSKWETSTHQAGGSSERVDFESKVPDEPKGNEYESWGGSGDEANVKGDDEDVQDSDDKPQYVNDEITDYENQETKDDKEETNDKFVYSSKLYQEDAIMTNVAHVRDEQTQEQTTCVHEESVPEMQVPKETITSSDTTVLEEFDQKATLFETMIKSKSFNKIPKHIALYHALMESTLRDKEAINEGVAEKLKKMKPDDADKDEGPSTRSDQDSDYAEHDDADMPKDQGQNLGKTAEQPNNEADPKNAWYKKSSSDTSPDPEWNEDKLVDDGQEQSWLNDIAKATKPPLTFDELMHTPIDFSAFVIVSRSTVLQKKFL
nr:hypothetical protein [Tanacetum cinerariifolium]